MVQLVYYDWQSYFSVLFPCSLRDLSDGRNPYGHNYSITEYPYYRCAKMLTSLFSFCLPLALSGVFPQDEYPEEVSTDEDDDEMFGSRKRMKRGRALEEEESSPPKKRKGTSNSLFIH